MIQILLAIFTSIVVLIVVSAIFSTGAGLIRSIWGFGTMWLKPSVERDQWFVLFLVFAPFVLIAVLSS